VHEPEREGEKEMEAMNEWGQGAEGDSGRTIHAKRSRGSECARGFARRKSFKVGRVPQAHAREHSYA